MKRHKISSHKSKKMFRHGVNRIHPRNATITPMRGGFRI